MKLNYDLADHHELIGNMFPKLSASEAWEKYKLSDDQVEFFNEFGYLHNVQILDVAQIEKLKEELELIIDPTNPKKELFYEFHSNQSEDPDKTLFHSLGHWRITEGFHDILWNPRFVVAACQLLGNKAVRYWHDQLFVKPAYYGGVVAWHQDFSYWTRTTPMQHLTCWVSLDDVSKENGCVYYIPKSHRWKLLDMPSLTGDMDGLNKYLNKSQQKEFENKVPIEMSKGYGTFHHPLMVHGSYANSSSRPRRAFVLNVFGDGTLSNSDDALLEGVNVVKKGEKMGGKFFPLLFDPANK